ncbi:hypothetical protein RI367_005160 [Sorochytrium milnesiophthora]
MSWLTGSSSRPTSPTKEQMDRTFGLNTTPSIVGPATALQLSVESNTSALATTSNVFSKAIEGLAERQERLERLEEKFSDMEEYDCLGFLLLSQSLIAVGSESRNFAALAKKLREKEQNHSGKTDV